LKPEEERIWKDGMRFILITSMKGDQIPWEELQEEKIWGNFLKGDKWKQMRWENWLEKNPTLIESWETPKGWLAGEKEWIEGKDTAWEAVRRGNEETRERKQPLWEKNKEFWLRAREEMRLEKDEKHRAKLIRRHESEDRWKAYCANQLRMLKELNHKESSSGSEGHLLAHSDEVAAALTGDIRSPMDGHTLPERLGEDDPSVAEENQTSSSSSSSSISSSSTSSSSTSRAEEEDDLPPLIRIKDEEGEEAQRESSNESLYPEPVSTISSEG
jgi:hypothetical protein